MPTYTKNDKKLGRIFLRGRLGPHCSCGWVCSILCDYPVGKDKTCDRKLCEDCSHEIAPDTHYCPDHKAAWDKFVESGGVKNVLENVVPYKEKERR